MKIFKKIKQGTVHKLSKLTFGASITASMLSGYGSIGPQKYIKCRSRIKKIKTECNKPGVNRAGNGQVDTSNITKVQAPLALISQIQRSGGSLLSQLFDGHPQIHAHPHELKIGYPKKYYWPKIDLADAPERWFLLLFEDIVIEHAKEGFKKGIKADQTHPFHFVPYLQKEIFLQYVNSITPLRLRDIFDGYMTSYFNAWLNNFNINGNHKKYITAFTPRMAMRQENMDKFCKIYPDGKLISIVRDPKNWFPSASQHRQKDYGDISKALVQWKDSVNAMIRNKETFEEKLIIIRFEDLITKTKPVMQYFSNFLDIEFDDILLNPTFNGSPISANTSFELEKSKIIESTLYRYKTLGSEELKIIDSMTSDHYQTILDKAVKF
jgi:hypothetical protein